MTNGYKIQFSSVPVQVNYQPRSISSKNEKICKDKVKKFLKFKIIKIIDPNHDQIEFISHIFPVPKRSPGEYRIIFDLTDLNLFVRKEHFKMDSISDIIEMIKPGDFFASIDLTDAYYCIAMHILSIPYLTFIFCNVYYQFICLPQGLTSAPRIFTKVLRVVLAYLRFRGIRIASWIDDTLVAASSRSLCQDHTFLTVRTFEELGFVPNRGKSQLTPVQKICHLGLVWDSQDYSISIPLSKIIGVKSKCLKALSSRVTLRFLSSILGSIEFFRYGFPFAAVHYRRLQRFVNYCLDKNWSYDKKVRPSSAACIDLSWWSIIGDKLPARSLSPFLSDNELFCDASLSGWGCWSSNGKEAFGDWSKQEKELHINELECKAVLFAFQCFFRTTFKCNILIRSDSSTVVSYINKQGGSSPLLCDISLEIWEFCISRNLKIVASHLAGISNSRADRLSRIQHSDHSYYLTQECFEDLSDSLSFSLKIDCFASRNNFKIKNFISRYCDPLSSWVDAFATIWTDNVYLFPPYPIINRVISKFKSDNTGHGLLICPYWPSQSWFPSLLDLLISPPILIPPAAVVDENHRLPKHCQLVGWIIGSSHAERMAFLEKLGCVDSSLFLEKPLLVTKDIGPNSVIGTTNGHVITVESL